MPNRLRRACLAVGIALAWLTALPANAQAVLLLDQDALFAGSLYGQGVVARFEAERLALAAENERLASELEDEERSLTEKRSTMEPSEFAALAAAFDERVTETRNAQAQKAADLTRRLEAERVQFFEQVAGIVRDLAAARGASVVLDRRFALLASEDADITAAAIAQVDAHFGTGPSTQD